MSRIKIPTETWVELYSDLSGYAEGLLAIHPIYDDDGQRDLESDNRFCDIVNEVESILEEFFIKEEK
jgi:hypothetical protein